VLEVHRRFPQGIALLDPVENMGIKDEKFKELINVGTIAAFRLR
jgi:ATP-dependent RNA helicase DOB1